MRVMGQDDYLFLQKSKIKKLSPKTEFLLKKIIILNKLKKNGWKKKPYI